MRLDEVRIVESPFSKKILVVGGLGDIQETIKAAAKILADPAYKNHVIELSGDGGQTVFCIRPEDRIPGMTTVDLHIGFMKKRNGVRPEPYMFDILRENKDKITAAFNEKASPYESIYYAALDAALLSREKDGKPVEFEFRGRMVEVKGDTRPEDVENTFPITQRERQDYKPRPIPRY